MQHPPKKRIRKTSRRWPVWLMGAALVLSAAFVLLLPAIRKTFPAGRLDYEIVESTVRTIATREAEQLDTVTIYPDGKSSYTLCMRNGALMLEQNGTLAPIDQTYQTRILETLTRITMQNTVTQDAAEAADELEAMGFSAPLCRAVVRYLDGSEETMEVGSLVHGGTEYYYRWSGAPGIYLCDSGVPETLSVSQNLLLPFQQVSVVGSLVDSLRIQNANGECAFAFETGTRGELTAPCRYPVADDTVQTLLTAIGQFRLGAYEAPLTQENSAAYGFDQPLCVLQITQREGLSNVITEDGTLTTAPSPAQSLRFVIGREEGDFFYTCAYEGDIYLISRFLAETLVQADWRRLISRTPAAMGDRPLGEVVFELPDTTVEVRITRTEILPEGGEPETDAGGEEGYRTSATLNGRSMPQEQLELLLDGLNAFTVEGDIPANAVYAAEPSWRITLVTGTGEIRQLEGYRLDVFSDAVSVNGVLCHYVYNQAIDVLMTGLV